MSTPEIPQRLVGEMWWDNRKNWKFAEAVLLSTGLHFKVRDDNIPYEATLPRREGGVYEGQFASASGTVEAYCTIREDNTGVRHLKGKWRQAGQQLPWNAELECE